MSDYKGMVERHPDANPATRLQIGDVIRTGEGQCIVWLVNECRASALPMRMTDSPFSARAINISPNSEVKILERRGKAGLLSYITNGGKENTMKKNKKAKNTEKAASKPAAKEKQTVTRLPRNKSGEFKGHKVHELIRAMGKAGWKCWEAAWVFQKNHVDVNFNTIRYQIWQGQAGKGKVATISKGDLEALRPDKSLTPPHVQGQGGSKPAAKGKKEKAAVKKPEAKKQKIKPAREVEESDEPDDYVEPDEPEGD